MTKKKWICAIFVLVVAFVVMLCLHAKESDEIPSKELVHLQLDTEGEEFVLEQLEGIHRDTLIDHWGEPDGSLFGLFGDIWELSEDEFVTVYYSSEAVVQHIKLKMDA